MRRGIGYLAILFGLLLAQALGQSLAAQSAGEYGHYKVEVPDLFPTGEYATRRMTALARMGASTALLVRAADKRVRSNDVDYEFRQRNNMLYLSGVTEPNSALLLVPQGITIGGKRVQQLLLVAERSPMKEIWTGTIMGPEVASRVLGIETVIAYSKLDEVLDSLLPVIDTLYYDGWMHGIEREPLSGVTIVWEKEMRKRMEAKAPKLQVQNAGAILNAMRMVKSPAEIAMMQRAIDITVDAHRETIRRAKAGMHEYELEAIMEYNFRSKGAEDPGYGSIVGSGPNSCILHYETNRRRTERGNTVVMDCGAEYHGYSADVTRTVPIGGTFSAEQRLLYDLILTATDSAIALCRSGKSFRDPHRKAVEIISDGLVRLGIIKERSQYVKYFMHGTSHFLGMDVHDVGDMTRPLQPGVVLTVEPGIYIAPGSDCDPKWWDIGIRIEDDILVTDDAPVNMSVKLERTADEIESLMSDTP